MKVTDTKGILMIRMSSHEALRTIESLTKQLLVGSPNVGRLETILKGDGRDFSIAIDNSPDT